MSEVKELAAGRELDQAVAVKMGLKAIWHYPLNWPYCDCKNLMYYDDNAPIKMEEPYGWVEVPEYSTDIKAAWQIVEWLKAKGYEFHITWEPGEVAWEAGIYFPDEMVNKLHYGGVEDRSETAMLAICRVFKALPLDQVK